MTTTATTGRAGCLLGGRPRAGKSAAARLLAASAALDPTTPSPSLDKESTR